MSSSGCRRIAALAERVQLAVASDGDERIGEGRFAGELGEVVPLAVAFQRGTSVNIDEPEHRDLSTSSWPA